MVIWEKYVRKYIWDSKSTPFLIDVKDLSQLQARKELFLYTIFLSTPFSLLSAATGMMAYKYADLGYALLTLYVVSIVIAAAMTHQSKSRKAAIYCGTAPLAVLAHFIINGFPPNLHLLDHSVMIFAILSLLRYTFRIVTIVGAYAGLKPEPTPTEDPS
ncbi:MAG: hypothetical protein JKY20_00610 [Alphaproteobacteria bacterium]|nr:hypothetical protein [Alphaproteobacteria bacterium]